MNTAKDKQSYSKGKQEETTELRILTITLHIKEDVKKRQATKKAISD